MKILQDIFQRNITYIVRLNEKLNLKNNIFGKCNPKSSAGRLDIFCRTILNFSDEYEKIPLNYNGELVSFQKDDAVEMDIQALLLIFVNGVLILFF